MTKRISQSDLFNSFVSALHTNISAAQANAETAIYCHIPEDLYDTVVQYCKCHDWTVKISHITDNRIFYKISGWKRI